MYHITMSFRETHFENKKKIIIRIPHVRTHNILITTIIIQQNKYIFTLA